MNRALRIDVRYEGDRVKIDMGRSLCMTLVGEHERLETTDIEHLKGIVRATVGRQTRQKSVLALFLAEHQQECVELEEWRAKIARKVETATRSRDVKAILREELESSPDEVDREILLHISSNYLNDEGKLNQSPISVFYPAFYVDRPESLEQVVPILELVNRQENALHLLSRDSVKPGPAPDRWVSHPGWLDLRELGLARSISGGFYLEPFDEGLRSSLLAWRWFYFQSDLILQSVATYKSSVSALKDFGNPEYICYPSGDCCTRARNQTDFESANYRIPSKIPPYHFGCTAELMLHQRWSS